MQPRLPDSVEHWPLDRLRAYARNPRTHSDAQVAQIAASIVEFGWTNPVLVAGDGTVIAGHGRLDAARRLGLSMVPVLVLDHLSEAQRRAYVIADNKLALNAGWNDELLAAELHDLGQLGDGAMVERRLSVERTTAGYQFVIPGTEKPIPVPRVRYGSDGSQLVIPGAEQINGKTRLDRLMQKPFRPRVAQRRLSGTSLFGSARPK